MARPPQSVLPLGFREGRHEGVYAARRGQVNEVNGEREAIKQVHEVAAVTAEKHYSSYADRVRGQQREVIDVEALPSPVMNGDIPTVTLPKKVVDRGRQYCQFSLIGRLDFRKLSIVRARTIAKELWSPSGDWKMIPLGNGFFMLKLDSKDEFVKIWSTVWNFDNQMLRFIKWVPGFDPDKQRTSKTLLWVKFPKLGQEYWDYEILMTLAKGLGMPVGVDQRTLDREYGYFASVLVDIDLAKHVPDRVNVKEEDGTEFTQTVEIPKLPAYCNHCKMVGHLITQCRGLIKEIQTPTGRGEEVQGVNDGFQQVQGRNRAPIHRRNNLGIHGTQVNGGHTHHPITGAAGESNGGSQEGDTVDLGKDSQAACVNIDGNSGNGTNDRDSEGEGQENERRESEGTGVNGTEFINPHVPLTNAFGALENEEQQVNFGDKIPEADEASEENVASVVPETIMNDDDNQFIEDENCIGGKEQMPKQVVGVIAATNSNTVGGIRLNVGTGHKDGSNNSLEVLSQDQQEVVNEIELVKARMATPSLIPRLAQPAVGAISRGKQKPNNNTGKVNKASLGETSAKRFTRQNLPNLISS